MRHFTAIRQALSVKALFLFGLTFLLGTLFSCQQHKGETYTAFDDTLYYSVLDHNTTFFLPLCIARINESLFISDFHGDKMITELSLTDLNRIKTFAQRGSGPVEFSPPLLMWEYNNQLFVINKQKFRLGVFDVSFPDSVAGYKYKELFQFPNSVNQLVNINDSIFLAAGYFQDGRYAIVKDNGEISQYFGAYPEFFTEEKMIPYDAKAMFHQVKFTSNITRKRVAGVSSHVLDIIDCNTANYKVINRVYLGEYDYYHESGNIIRTSLKEGYSTGVRSVTSCSDYIYLLKNTDQADALLDKNSEILVYDWDGDHIHTYYCQDEIDMIKSINDYGFIGITEELELISIEIQNKNYPPNE